MQESTRCTSKREAQEYEEKRRKEVRHQILLGKKPKRKWAEAVLRWLDEMQHKRSLYDDVSHFKWLQAHLNPYTLDEITKDVIEKIARIKEAAGCKAATVNRMLCVIRALLNRAHKQWEWIDRVPAFPTRHVDNARIRWITRAEADRLLGELPGHLKAMAAFTLATGLRAGNVANLKWAEINFKLKHAVVHPDESKNKKPLGVPLNADAMAILKEQKGKHPTYVFTYRGKPVTQINTKAWRNAVRRAGIKNFRWHDLRHTWASWHVQSGTSLPELVELGGWATFEMVLRYAHLSSSHLTQAADRISSGANMVKSKSEGGKNES
nr:site-specific integrase [Aquicella siphonis]